MEIPIGSDRKEKMVTPIIKVILIVGSLFIGICSVYIFKMKPDNIVEQISEEVIKEETGLTIDLSPENEPIDSEKSVKQ
jgi:hypothetical protein